MRECERCTQKAECSRETRDRAIRMNAELTKIHEEVISNLKSEFGITLRANRSVQAEGATRLNQVNRSYKRVKRRGIESIIFEFTLISIGFNLYKYHDKKHRAANVA